MTQSELDAKLVSDIAMIYDEACLWGMEEAKGSLEFREELIRCMLNARQEGQIMEAIEGAMAAAGDAKTIGYLQREFLSGTATLLRYRLEKADEVTEIMPIESDPALGAESLRGVAEDLAIDGSTVIQHRALREMGSRQALVKALRNALMDDSVSIKVIQTSPGMLREKNNFLGHRIWAMTPSTPIVKVTIG